MNRKRDDDIVDEASEESFPASDPPSYMGSAAVAGAPPDDRKAEPSGGPSEPVSREVPANAPAEAAATETELDRLKQPAPGRPG